MKHKHCELIKAWADGAEIECKFVSGVWRTVDYPDWANPDEEYRIKPEPKPDDVSYFYATTDDISYTDESGANLKVTFDGETGEPKSAEVFK